MPNNNSKEYEIDRTTQDHHPERLVLLPKKGKGSHARYTKDGRIYTVPFHKGKEIDNDFAKKILKDLGIQ